MAAPPSGRARAPARSTEFTFMTNACWTPGQALSCSPHWTAGLRSWQLRPSSSHRGGGSAALLLPPAAPARQRCRRAAGARPRGRSGHLAHRVAGGQGEPAVRPGRRRSMPPAPRPGKVNGAGEVRTGSVDRELASDHDRHRRAGTGPRPARAGRSSPADRRCGGPSGPGRLGRPSAWTVRRWPRRSARHAGCPGTTRSTTSPGGAAPHYTGLDGRPAVLEERCWRPSRRTTSRGRPRSPRGARFRCAYLNAEEFPGSSR